MSRFSCHCRFPDFYQPAASVTENKSQQEGQAKEGCKVFPPCHAFQRLCLKAMPAFRHVACCSFPVAAGAFFLALIAARLPAPFKEVVISSHWATGPASCLHCCCCLPALSPQSSPACCWARPAGPGLSVFLPYQTLPLLLLLCHYLSCYFIYYKQMGQ